MELTNKNEKDYIELSSSDNKIFYINRRTASLSKQLEPLFEMDGLNEQIKLNNVSAGVLEKMIKFCEFHSEIPFMDIEKPLKSDVLSECISDWDNAFLKQFKQEELIEMLYAANYLEIQSLLDLGCAAIAALLKNKTPSEIRKSFHINTDITQEEENALKQSNKWIEDN